MAASHEEELGAHEATALGEVRRDRRQVGVLADLEDDTQTHRPAEEGLFAQKPIP